jgi:hypothetical protein
VTVDDQLAYHVGRSFSGSTIEDACPCPQEPCGLIRMDRARAGCLQHALGRAKTMRQAHPGGECPGGAK